MYSLIRDDYGTHYLEVVCGGVAMEIVKVILAKEEIESFELEGVKVLNDSALRVAKDRKYFESRNRVELTGIHGQLN